MVAGLEDITPGGVPMLLFISIVLTAVVSLLWYFWPHWLPWRWLPTGRKSSRSSTDGKRRTRRYRHRFRLGVLRFRWRWRRRKRRKAQRVEEQVEHRPPDELPELPASVMALTADQLAAAGRYAEAVRERLRAMVRELIERDVIPHVPGWTVTELAAAATTARPALTPALRAAVDIFSEIWYGLRSAGPDDDRAMREHAQEVSRLVAQPVPAAAAAEGGA